jgi:acyl-CoA synthetase (AMP-forming)/AMP-acid ligase II
LSAPGFRLGDALADARHRGSRWARLVEADRERRIDVAALDRAADGVAAELVAKDVVAGARVGLRVRNTAAHLAAMFGVWRAGGVLVPLAPRLTETEAAALLEHAGAAAVLEVDGASGERALSLRGGRSVGRGAGAGSDDLAVIAYTSGTTGRPKGVELTHANLLWAAAAVAKTRRDDERSVAVAMSPLCHVPVFVSHYLARLLTGGTVLLGSFDPEAVARLVREHGVTDLPLVPAMVGPLLAADPRGSESLVKVTVGSAHTPMAVKQSLAERFPRAEILEAYGQTETTDGLTMTVGREALERPGTVGRAHALVVVAVVAADGRLLGPGEKGEIAARGPTVMRGYLDDPERTAEVLRDGWLRTGDLGRLDGEGYLFIEGRLKEVIISGGENVSPEEVETVLARHPAVVEVAVFGVPHERWGEQVAAAVVARGDLSIDDLREFARASLAPFKLPGDLLLVERLPRTSAGKVQRGELQKLHGAGSRARSGRSS